MTKLSLGERVYNHGDMANASHFGTVTDIRTSQFGTDYQITPDRNNDYRWSSDRDPYYVPAAIISPEFKGHSGTRIVTVEAYNDWRDASMSDLTRRIQQIRARKSA